MTKITVLRDIIVNGQAVKNGDVVEVTKSDAGYLIGSGMAKPAVENNNEGETEGQDAKGKEKNKK